jgi:5-methylcytosine-specific restriction enzyme subunit McrC
MKQIEIREHEKLLFKDYLDYKYLNADLNKIYKTKDIEDKFFQTIPDGVKFKSYVGLIQTRDCTISILPKTGFEGLDKDKDKIYKLFIDLLVFCGHLRKAPKLFCITPEGNKGHNSMLDLFILSFLDEVEDILHFGLLRGYKTITENNTYLKGKLNVSQHISQNMGSGSNRFNVTFQTYHFDNDFNRLLYMALQHIAQEPKFKRYQSHANQLMAKFPGLSHKAVEKISMVKLLSDRRIEKYHVALEIAYNLLNQSNPAPSKGNDSFTILYNMNTLFQEYIYKLARHNGYNAVINEQEIFWSSLDNKESVKIKPDVVLYEGDKATKILEVKWVDWDKSSINRGYMSQIYTYSKVYKNIPVFLVYPKPNDKDPMAINGTFKIENELAMGGIRFQSLVDSTQSKPQLNKKFNLKLSKEVEAVSYVGLHI